MWMPEGKAGRVTSGRLWLDKPVAEPERLKKSLAFSPDQKLTSCGLKINCNGTRLVSCISSKDQLTAP